MAHPLFSFLRSFFHRISRMNRRHSCLSDYSRIFADIWPLANGWRPKYSLIVFVTQISQIYTDFLHHDFSSSDFTDESEAFLLIGLLTEFRRTLAADQWLAPDICSCCFLSHRFHRYTQIFYGISGESLCQSQGVSATTGQVASVKIRE